MRREFCILPLPRGEGVWAVIVGGSGCRWMRRCPDLAVPRNAHTCAEPWGTFCFKRVSGLAQPMKVDWRPHRLSFPNPPRPSRQL